MPFVAPALPPYPPSQALASLPPSQRTQLLNTVTTALKTALSPSAALGPSHTAFVRAFAHDAAHHALAALVWPDNAIASAVDHKLALMLAQRVPDLDLQSRLDLAIAFPKRRGVRTLFENTTAAECEALVDALTTLLRAPHALYSQRKTAHTLLCAVRTISTLVPTQALLHALAHAYGPQLSSVATNYGGLPRDLSNADEANVDDWLQIWLQTKVALLDAFHILLTRASLASEVMAMLLSIPMEGSSTDGQPFVDRSLVSDYDYTYGLARTLGKRAAEDAAIRSLMYRGDHSGPGALRILLGSGVPASIPPPNKGKGRAVETVTNSAPQQESNAMNEGLDVQVTQVLDVFPDLASTYVRALLQHPACGQTVEGVVGALLEGRAPSEGELNAPRVVHTDHSIVSLEQAPAPNERRNIWDEEEMDLSRLRVGKATDDTAAVLRDREAVAALKADILRRAEALSSDEEEESDGEEKTRAKPKTLAYESEADSDDAPGGLRVRDGSPSGSGGDDSASEDGAAPDTESVLLRAYITSAAVFARNAEARKGKARVQLRTDTGWGDEQIEGWAVMLERNPRKDRILERASLELDRPDNASVPVPSSSRGRPRGRGRGSGVGGQRGGGRGGSGAGDGARERAWKEKNKARRGNHARKEGRGRKVARAGGPG